MMARLRFILVNIFLICSSWVAVCETKRTFQTYMPGSYCSSRLREIDGALLRSSSNPLYANSACRFSFRSDGHRFWVNFENWQVSDCDLKLKIYFASSIYSEPNMVLDCRSTPTSFVTPGRYLTMKLEKWSNTGYSFRIVVTSFKKKSKWSCPKSHCGIEDMCLDSDVWCDGVRNCPNGTDETNCNLFNARRNRNSGGAMLGGILMLFGMVVVALVLLVWCRRRQTSRGQIVSPPPGGYTMQQQPLYQQQPMPATMPGFDRTVPPPQPAMFPNPAPMGGPPMGGPPMGGPPMGGPPMGGPPMYPPAAMPPQMPVPYPPQGPPPAYDSIKYGPTVPPYS